MPESYLHRYSKIVLASWLRKQIRIGEKFKGLNGFELILDWDFCKKCTDKGLYSVYLEYPVCIDTKTKQTIGLTLESWRQWLTDNNINVSAKCGIPNPFELKDIAKKASLKLLHIFDVVIIDTEGLKYVFEICHKHECDNSKIEWIKNNNIYGFELDATWIMERVESPYNVEIKRTLH